MSSHHEPHRRLPYFAAQSIGTAWPNGFRFVVGTQLNRPRPDTKKASWLIPPSFNGATREPAKRLLQLTGVATQQPNNTDALRPRQAHQSIFSISPRG